MALDGNSSHRWSGTKRGKGLVLRPHWHTHTSTVKGFLASLSCKTYNCNCSGQPRRTTVKQLDGLSASWQGQELKMWEALQKHSFKSLGYVWLPYLCTFLMQYGSIINQCVDHTKITLKYVLECFFEGQNVGEFTTALHFQNVLELFIYCSSLQTNEPFIWNH